MCPYVDYGRLREQSYLVSQILSWICPDLVVATSRRVSGAAWLCLGAKSVSKAIDRVIPANACCISQ